MNAKQIGGAALMGAGLIGGNLIPLKSIYNSIHEDRSFGSSLVHFGGSAIAGTAVGGAAALGGMALLNSTNPMSVAKNIAKGF